LNIYIAPLGDSEALQTQVRAVTSKQDSLKAFPKKGKRKGEEELKAQLLRKIVPARGADIGKASGLSSGTAHEGNNQKASGS